MPRYNDKPEGLNELLHETKGPLASIAQRSQLLLKLTSVVHHICPDLPKDSFRLANITSHGIVIEAKSPVWGQRLQFERNGILKELQQFDGFESTHIEIKVVPFGFPSQVQAPKPKKQISTQAAEQLMQVAESAPASLKEKIEKLARHAK